MAGALIGESDAATPIRVGVVDDHPVVGEGTAALLRAQPDLAVVGVAVSLEAAREAGLTDATAVDVLLLDIRLGTDSGLRLLSDVASRGEGPLPAVIVLTAYDYPQYADAALSLGAAGFVLKTAPLPELVDAIRRVAAGGLAFAVRPRTRPRPPARRASTTSSASSPTAAATTRSAPPSASAPKTVETHLSRIFERFGVSSRTELAARAVREGWLDVPPRADARPHGSRTWPVNVPVRSARRLRWRRAEHRAAAAAARARAAAAPRSARCGLAGRRRRARHHRGGRPALDPHRVAADGRPRLARGALRLPPARLRGRLLAQPAPKLDQYDDYVFIVLHFPLFEKDTGRILTAELDLFMGPDYLITLPNIPLPPLTAMFERYREKDDLREDDFSKGSGYLLYKIVDTCVDASFPMLRKMGLKLDRLEDDIFEGRSSEIVRDISEAKQEIINFRKIVRPQRAVLRDLERTKQRYLQEELEIYFDDISDAAERIWDTLENYKEVVEALESTNESVLSHRLNDSFRILTAASVVLLPLTLIASIFGMNVPVPGRGPADSRSSAILPLMALVLLGARRLLPPPRLAVAGSGREVALRGAHVAHVRADQPVVGGLLEDVRRPAGVARQRERGGEQVGREAHALEHRRRVELDVGLERPLGVASRRARAGRRPRPRSRARATRAGAASTRRPCGAPPRAGRRRGRRGARSPSAARLRSSASLSHSSARSGEPIWWSWSTTSDGAPPWSGPFIVPIAPDDRRGDVRLRRGDDPRGERRGVEAVLRADDEVGVQGAGVAGIRPLAGELVEEPLDEVERRDRARSGSRPWRSRANAASTDGEIAVRARACSTVGGQSSFCVAPHAETAVRSASIGLARRRQRAQRRSARVRHGGRRAGAASDPSRRSTAGWRPPGTCRAPRDRRSDSRDRGAARARRRPG